MSRQEYSVRKSCAPLCIKSDFAQRGDGGINRLPRRFEEGETSRHALGGEWHDAMPCQYLQVPPGERVGLRRVWSTGSDADILGRGSDGRLQLLPDINKTLPKLAFHLGLPDAERHGIADGGLLFPEPCRIESAGTLLEQVGKLIGAVKRDGQRLQCAGNQGETLHRLAERLDADVVGQVHGVGERSGYPLASTLRNASQAATMRLSSATTSAWAA